MTWRPRSLSQVAWAIWSYEPNFQFLTDNNSCCDEGKRKKKGKKTKQKRNNLPWFLFCLNFGLISKAASHRFYAFLVDSHNVRFRGKASIFFPLLNNLTSKFLHHYCWGLYGVDSVFLCYFYCFFSELLLMGFV